MTEPVGQALPPQFWRPEDIEDWRRWQRAQWPLARRVADTGRTALAAARAAVTRAGASRADAGLRLLLPAGDVHTLVAVESAGPTQRAALVEPVAAVAQGRSRHSPEERAAVLEGIGWVLPADAAERLAVDLPTADLTALPVESAPERLGALRRVLVAGEYLPAGRAAVRWARERGAGVGVVQHGLLAVSTPPLPREVTLYAFTEQDGLWWANGRGDVRVVPVGSALLEAARMTPTDPHDDGPGVFLGQLHGAELPRAETAAAAEQYLRATGAAYRPHPAEQDRLSRAQHARWEAAGIRVDRSGQPLSRTRGPVAAVFSTGILEAAQAGRPAWAVHPDPPRWLQEFWERYRISRWTPGHVPQPTPALVAPTPDPAAAVADDLWRSRP